MTYESNKSNASYALNSYVSKLLEVNMGFDTASYNGGRFIVPLAQQPELLQTGQPFLTYGSSVHAPGHNYALRKEAIAYSIWATSSTKVNAIVQLLVDCFERQDEAAADVNEWLGMSTIPFEGITFGSVKLEMTENANPPDQEGGFVQGFVLLTMTYTVVNDSAQFSGFTP